MSRKATHAEVEERVTEVYILLIRGASRADILRHAADRWHLATRQAEDYLARANERLRALASFVSEEELGKARERLNDLYSKNYRVQSYRDALACQKELNELLGLYPVKTERHELALVTSAEWIALRDRILDALEPYPEALAAVMEAIDERPATKALPA